jgi:hypothetical protein
LLKDYFQLRYLDSSQKGGLKLNWKNLDIDTSFLERYDLLNIEQDENIDNLLLQITQEEPRNKDSLMALRCKVSHSIVKKIKQIHEKYQDSDRININEMYVILLDDNGEDYLKILSAEKSQKASYIKKIFCWETIKFMEKNKNINPFSAEIISQFNSSLSNLNTWTSNKVQGNNKLKSYLIKCGILLQTKWSLIADSSSRRIIEAWNRCGEGGFTSEYIKKLYDSYIKEYKKAKIIYKKEKGKTSGWQPDEEFLKSLDPPQKNTDVFDALDNALRNYLTGVYKTAYKEDYEDFGALSTEANIEDELDKKLIKKIESSLRNCGKPIIKELIKKDKQKWAKDKSRELCWQLYGDGLSQREIASRCEHKQAWVSKMIPEKKISESIAQETAIVLLRIEDFSDLKKDPDGIDRLVDGLRNHLINSELDVKGSLLRELIKEETRK